MTAESLFNSQFPARTFQPNNSQESGGHVHRSHRAVTLVTGLALDLCPGPRSGDIIVALQDHHE
jgi:hypothetical protein